MVRHLFPGVATDTRAKGVTTEVVDAGCAIKGSFDTSSDFSALSPCPSFDLSLFSLDVDSASDGDQ
jgi:hypothetical protein